MQPLRLHPRLHQVQPPRNRQPPLFFGRRHNRRDFGVELGGRERGKGEDGREHQPEFYRNFAITAEWADSAYDLFYYYEVY